jgi:glycosyltransferase involved in cell wall biosynthesis
MSDAESHSSSARRPKVSVCIVTYNHVDYIGDCVRSAILQEGPFDLEILVGDDCSTDGTRPVLRSMAKLWPDVLVIFEHERNLGPSANLKYLMSRATGDFVAHLDGDDFWMPGKLRRQINFLQSHHEASAVYCNAIALGPDMEPLGVFNNTQPELFDGRFLLERGNFLNHSTLCYRALVRSELLEIQGQFFDYRMHIRLSMMGMLGYLNCALVGYRIGVNASMSNTMSGVMASMYWEAISDAAIRSDYIDAARTCAAHFTADRLVEAARRFDFKAIKHWIAMPDTLPPSLQRGVRRRAITQVITDAIGWLLRGRWLPAKQPAVRVLFVR